MIAVKRDVSSVAVVFRQVLFTLGFFCCAVLFPLSVGATSTTEHLYEVSILAVDQSEGERQKSLRQGLQEVLIRISGQTHFSANTSIQEALANPDSYLQQFAYVSLTETEKANLKAKVNVSGRTVSKGGVLPTVRINARFSSELVKALLRRAQLPVWPSNRPSVLVWLAVDSGNGKHLLNQSDSAYDFLLQETARRGLPMVLPMNDLNDQVTLGVNRLWSLDQVAITEASQRYGEDTILVGRIAQTAPGQWQGNWLYLVKGQSQLIDSSDEDLEEFITHGVDAVVQAQVQRYGISPASTVNRVNLEISGISSLERYVVALNFLKSLDLVKSLAVTTVNGTVLHCALEIEGNSPLLKELMELGHVLISEDPPEVEIATEVPTLHYRFSAQ